MSTWTKDVWKIILICPPPFSAAAIYESEGWLKRRHPNNNNIKAKIRQQLQILRDKGLIVHGKHPGDWFRIGKELT